MNSSSFLLVLALFVPLIVACNHEESEASGAVEGPALIMFYTDG